MRRERPVNAALAFPPDLDVSKLRSACSECSLLDMCFPIGVSTPDQLRLRRAVRQIGAYRRGEYVFRRGDSFFAIYAVREGSLKRFIVDRAGRERVVSFHFKGEVFGFDAISSGLHSSDCIALEPTSLCVLPYIAVQDFACDYPKLYAELIRLMSCEISSQVRASSGYGAKERAAAFLLALADRFRKTGDCVTELDIKMSRQDMAYYLAMAPETLSRVFSEFELRQIIKTEGKKIALLDRARLESIV